MKWGKRYGADYANRLYSMVKRNTSRPTRVLCFTDDPSGIVTDVTCHPLPPIPGLPERVQWKGWRKISLWQAPLADLEGDVLFLDLDLVVTGPLDDFFDFEKGRFCVIKNWTQPELRIGNTSVYRFPVGKHTYIYDDFVRDPESIVPRFRNSQSYISDAARDMVFWPAEWCLSFKHNLLPRWPMNFFVAPKLPPGTRVVAFTGKPDPDEARDGRWPVTAAWKRLYKHVRPVPWIAEHWQ